MSSTRLIICEKSSHWATALRSAKTQIIETRSLTACQAALDESLAALVALEVTSANLEAAVEFVVSCRSRYLRTVFVALVAADVLAAESLLREAGAIDVATSVLDAPRFARFIRRHVQQAPQRPQTVAEFVAARLPWPAHATNSAGGQQQTS